LEKLFLLKIMNRSKLTTEKRNKKTADIDRRSTIEIINIINEQDMLVAPAVAKERKHIAAAADLIAESFRQGGRLFYVGAGTSGRLGVLDASECPPTYGVSPKLVQGIIAGGRRALVRSIEGAEDSAKAGADALTKKHVKSGDVVVGIAACGITPFVHGAMKRARQVDARTIFITCAPQAKKHIAADIIINPVVGPEVITGSTRMKAGTATKLILNTLTTTAMIKTGKVYGNLMVDLKATNDKLRDRSERIIMSVTGLSRIRARKLLVRAGAQVKAAIVMHFKKIDFAEARRLLKVANESLRDAIGK
jgi:N-acetylmuramic acid 6-phosphate etherase